MIPTKIPELTEEQTRQILEDLNKPSSKGFCQLYVGSTVAKTL